jgi:uncharacterized protein YbjT (DUF2867 family)
MKDGVVTVFGGGGFIGRYAVQELLAGGEGWRVRVAQRDPKRAYFLRPLGALGQLQFLAADIRRKELVARAVAGAHAVVNLVGVLDGDFQGFHVDGARIIAEAAAEAGARALVHVSAIGADANSPSKYGRSKGLGEEAVRAAFPGATILRPSIVFGREDGFTNRFAQMIRTFPVVPLVRGGTKFQPVFVADLAQAIGRAVQEPEHFGGRTFEIGGPERLSMADLNRRLADWTGRRKTFVDLPDGVAAAMARVGRFLPGAPITWDQWLMLQQDNVVAAGADGLDAFGVAPTPMSAVAPNWLVQYRPGGRFAGVKTVES